LVFGFSYIVDIFIFDIVAAFRTELGTFLNTSAVGYSDHWITGVADLLGNIQSKKLACGFLLGQQSMIPHFLLELLDSSCFLTFKLAYR
jgi:hypothetical protein